MCACVHIVCTRPPCILALPFVVLGILLVISPVLYISAVHCGTLQDQWSLACPQEEIKDADVSEELRERLAKALSQG